MNYLARAKEICTELGLVDLATDLTTAPLQEVRQTVASVRIASPHYGQVWVCRDEGIASEIEAEGHGLPILTFAEVSYLRDKSPEMLRAIFAAKVGLGRAWVIQ